jgi:hypothetical protein
VGNHLLRIKPQRGRIAFQEPGQICFAGEDLVAVFFESLQVDLAYTCLGSKC